MNQKKITVKNLLSLEKVKKQITNALTEEGTNLKEALMNLISELESSEAEVSEAEMKEAITSFLSEMKEEEIPEAIANAIAKAAAKIQNSVKGELPLKVKNEVAAAIMRSRNKGEVANAVNEVLVKNAITGYSFADVVDFAVVTGWEKLNPILESLHQTLFTKFFYTEADMDVAAAIAKQWNKSSVYDKLIQQLTITGKQIQTKYIYKRQQMAAEDLDEIEQAGQSSYFEQWINSELDQMIANTIVMAILVGDTVNAAGDRVTTFETIGTKTTSDLFTTVSVVATPAITDYRAAVDTVKNPNGSKKVAIMTQETLTSIAGFVYGTGGTTHYRTKEEVAGQLGVDEIHVTDVLELAPTVKMVVLIPDEYWVREKKALEVAYPTYEKNVMNFMKERNIGGAIHGMFSTAVLKTA